MVDLTGVLELRLDPALGEVGRTTAGAPACSGSVRRLSGSIAGITASHVAPNNRNRLRLTSATRVKVLLLLEGVSGASNSSDRIGAPLQS